MSPTRPRRSLVLATGLAGALLVGVLAVVPDPAPAAAEPAPVPTATWGGYGTAAGQFRDPWGVAVAGDEVYVADSFNHRVQVFDTDGTFLRSWRAPEPYRSTFRPTGIDVDAGVVYVTDSDDDVVLRFLPDGTPLGTFGTDVPAGFDAANGIDARGGDVYVADGSHDRIVRLHPDGSFVSTFGVTGGGPGELLFPNDVAVAPGGDVYVADSENHRIQRFTADGAYVSSFGAIGQGPYGFNLPYRVAVDEGGDVYVGDTLNEKVKKYTADGTFLARWDGTAAGPWWGPIGLDVAPDGQVYVATASHRIVRFTATTQPDLRIKGGLTGAFVGDDVYNTTTADQARRVTVRRGVTAHFVVWVQNDARTPDAVRLRGSTATGAFRVRYTVDGERRTTVIGAGTYVTPVLEPGATLAVQVEVLTSPTAARGSSLTGTLTATSTTDTSRKDRVRYTTTIS